MIKVYEHYYSKSTKNKTGYRPWFAYVKHEYSHNIKRSIKLFREVLTNKL